MKILKLSSYYEPEQISSSHMSSDLENAYMDADIVIENYVPTPTRGVTDEVRREYKKKKYEEKFGGKIIVHRFSMFREGKNPIFRALRYVLVNLVQYNKGSHAKDIDVITAGSTPPTQGTLCSLVKKKLSKKYGKNVPFVFILQDIFPDSLVNAKMTRKGSMLWKIGRKIEDFTYRNADKIIVISEAFKRNIMEKGVPEEKIVIVPNWIDIDEVAPVSREDNRLFEEFSLDREKFTVVYAGNFGVTQGTDVILQAAELLKDNNEIQFVLFGGGAEYEKAVETVKSKQLSNVTIDKLLPQERVPEVYSLGDVALITCKKGVGESGMPSKTWSIMACNTPIIASFDTNSEMAEILTSANAGACVEPENAEELAKAISNYAEGKTEKYTGGREYVSANASKKNTLKYVETIKSAAAGK